MKASHSPAEKAREGAQRLVSFSNTTSACLISICQESIHGCPMLSQHRILSHCHGAVIAGKVLLPLFKGAPMTS
jgi:hypothetical protein